MVDPTKKTVATIGEIKKLDEELTADSIIGKIDQAKASYREMTEDFKDLAARITEQGKSLVMLSQMLDVKSSSISHLIGGTTSFVPASAFPFGTEDFTDDAKFIVFCDKALNHANPLKALSTVRKAIDTANNLIEDWRQKIAKMQSLDGRTEAEIAVFKKKAFAAEKTLKFFMKRGETLTNILYTLKRNIEKSVRNATQDVKPIFCK